MFTKAEPMAAYMKAAMYGPPGSGKTFTALMCAEGLAAWRKKRVAVIDTEHGTKFYAVENKTARVHPAAFDFDVLHTRSLAQALKAVETIDPNVYGVVIVDSISHIWQAAIEAYEGRMTSQETIPLHAWSKIKAPYKLLIDKLMHGPFDAFVLGRQKNVFDQTADGELRKAGVTMKSEGETPYEPDFCFRMEGVVDERDTTRTTYRMHVEKDRSRTLAGQVIANPTFETIQPIIPFLGTEAVPEEDEEERLAADAEAQEEQAKKKKVREEKSAETLTTFQGQIAQAKTMEEIGALGADIKKKTRYMTEQHVNVLRATYTHKRDKIQRDTVPEV